MITKMHFFWAMVAIFNLQLYSANGELFSLTLALIGFTVFSILVLFSDDAFKDDE